MKNSYLINILILIFFLSGCKQKEAEKPVVASVYEYKLYLEDLMNVIPRDIHGSDSVLFVQNYINRWTQQKAILHFAHTNIDEDELKLDEKIQKYRNSLILYEYQKRFVEQNLDTIVSDTEIEEYYKSHKSDFLLKRNIVKVAFIQLPKKSENLNEVRRLLKNYTDEDKVKLSDIASREAVNYFLDDEVWILFDDLLKVVPLKTYNQESFLKNNKFVTLKDSLYITFVRINGFRIKDGISPLSFEYDKIRMIIIGKRKQLLVEKLHREVFDKAKADGAIKINY